MIEVLAIIFMLGVAALLVLIGVLIGLSIMKKPTEEAQELALLYLNKYCKLLAWVDEIPDSCNNEDLMAHRRKLLPIFSLTYEDVERELEEEEKTDDSNRSGQTS